MRIKNGAARGSTAHKREPQTAVAAPHLRQHASHKQCPKPFIRTPSRENSHCRITRRTGRCFGRNSETAAGRDPHTTSCSIEPSGFKNFGEQGLLQSPSFSHNRIVTPPTDILLCRTRRKRKGPVRLAPKLCLYDIPNIALEGFPGRGRGSKDGYEGLPLYFVGGRNFSSSRPPTYGRRASGTTTPSAVW